MLRPIRFITLLSLTNISIALADPILSINPQEYGMHKSFGPPLPITPQNVLITTPENQFDLSKRYNYTNAVNQINARLDKPFHLTIGQFGNSNYTGLLWRQREANYYIISNIAHTDANDYRDGDGHRIDFGYQRNSAALVLGLLPTMTSEHRLTLIYDDIKDDKQPQHVMDPSDTQRIISKYDLRLGHADDSNTIHLGLSAIDLKRQANNNQLRKLPAKAPKISMDVKRQKYAAELSYHYTFNQQHRSHIGIRFEDDHHDAKRFVQTPRGKRQNGYRFPNIQTQTSRIYAAHEWQPNDHHNLKVALNYDWQTASVRGANQTMQISSLPTAAMLWQNYYGKKFNGKIKQDGLSGKFRYTFKFNPQQQYYAEFSSLYRLPENPERFAVLPGPAYKGWASNPWLKPERENRLTLGMQLNGNGWKDYQSTWQDNYASAWQLNSEVFYANVDDFITLDRYRGKKRPLQGNVISRNVDAKLMGVDINYRKNWNQNLSSAISAQYRYGQNTRDNRPLYQIAPFEVNLSIDWQNYFSGGSYSIGSRIRHQHQQTRRDDNPLTGLGIDHMTNSFTTLDIYAGIDWKNNIGVSLGVNNVFNHTYAEYITGNHVESVSPRLVNAPGRVFWLRFNAAF